MGNVVPLLGIIGRLGAAPPVPTSYIIPVTLTISGNEATVIFESPNYQDNNYKIERRENSGSWMTIEAAWNFTSPMESVHSGYQNIFPYMFYIDSDLTYGVQYEYRITGGDGQGTSNAVIVTRLTYYVKNGGNDSNSGLSDGAALATISAGLAKMASGDLLLFKKGSTWSQSSTINIPAISGTLTKPCKIGSYGTGNKPVFNITTSTGLMLQNRSYWVLSGISMTGSTVHNIWVRALAASMSNIKILDMMLDGSNHGASAEDCLLLYEQSGGVLTNVEIGWSIAKNAGNGIGNIDGFKVWFCTSGFWGHNCYGEDNGSETFDIAGGIGPICEWNIIKNAALQTLYNTGTKMHGQVSSGHDLENGIYRRNLIMKGGGYGLSMQDSLDGICEYNTVYKAAGYGAYFEQTTNNNARHTGNCLAKNIIVGSGGGSNGTFWSSSVGANWYKRFFTKENCIYAPSGYAARISGAGADNITNAQFPTKWNGTYDHESDICENPQFTSIAGNDFTTNNANVSDKGFFAPVITNAIECFGGIVNNLSRNTIVIYVDKPLDTTYSTTTGISVAGKTVTGITVYRYRIEITVSTNFTAGAAISVSLNMALKDKYGNLTFPVVTLSTAAGTLKNGVL